MTDRGGKIGEEYEPEMTSRIIACFYFFIAYETEHAMHVCSKVVPSYREAKKSATTPHTDCY